MVLCFLSPDGPIDGEPVWRVVSGASTLLDDPSHPAWDPSKPPGYQKFLVSETLPAGENGPMDTEYEVTADADLGSGVQHITESIILHVMNMASSLGLTFGVPQPKP